MTTAIAMPEPEPDDFHRWDSKTQEQAAAELRAAMSVHRQVWYCTDPGRLCDGKPHEGYPYKHARSDQWPPEGVDWFVWMLRGGRGSGKTRSGAEYTRKVSEKVARSALIAPTSQAVRDTCIEGESGLIAVLERAGQRGYDWEPSKRKFTFPNGHVAYTYSGEEPDRLRGPQHGFAWLDEPAHIPLIGEVWSNLLFGLRLGRRPHILCTTTPLPTKWIKDLVAHPKTVSVVASTYANLDNLAPSFRETVVSQFEGTRLGRQELHGEILADIEGALWIAEWLRSETWVAHEFDRIVVGIDPAGTAHKRSDETGIIVAARLGDLYYVIADASGRMSPEAWAATADSLYDRFLADALIPEQNYGGDMVKATLRNTGRDAMFVDPVIARRGKALRAEPIAALYEQKKVIHMPAPGQDLSDLESEMLEWAPGRGDSPNRVDALVHALTALANNGGLGSIALPGDQAMRGRSNLPRMSIFAP